MMHTKMISRLCYNAVMDILECIKSMIEQSDKSARQVSRELGRSATYLGATFANGSDVGASNAAKIAKVLGWKMVFKKGNEELEVTPRANSDQGPTD